MLTRENLLDDLLGRKLPSREHWLNDHWLQTLFEMSSRDVQFGAFRSWSRAVAGWMSTPRSLTEILPSLLVNDEALRFKSLELARYQCRKLRSESIL